MFLTEVCGRVFTPIKSSMTFMRSASTRGFPNVRLLDLGARMGRGFKTNAKLNYMRRLSKEERLMENHKGNSNGTRFGQGMAVGAFSSGLGALSLCGFGLFDQVMKLMQESTKWPKYVKDRIVRTYACLGASCIVSALSTAAILLSPSLVYFLTCRPTLAFNCAVASLLLTDTAVRSIPYEPGYGKKQFYWLAHFVLSGIPAIPLYKIGGPLVLRAAFLTAGLVGGMSLVAVSAPGKKFVETAGPAGMILGTALASCIASVFVPPASTIGGRLVSIAVHAALFPLAVAVWRDTTHIIKAAEYLHPNEVYDPLEPTMCIYVAAYKGVGLVVRVVKVFIFGCIR